MLQMIIDLADGKIANARAADRLKAAQYVLAVAGVTPAAAETLAEQKPPVAEEELPRRRSPGDLYMRSQYFPPPNWQDKIVEGKVRVLDEGSPHMPQDGVSS